MAQALSVQEQLLHAAYKGDLPGVKKLLAAGADINGKAFPPGHSPGREVSPLDEAVGANRLAVVQFLLSSGASVEGAAGAYALSVAKSEEIGKLLIARGADINAMDPYHTPLFGPMAFGEIRRVAWMLKAGADPNGRDRDRETPLHQLVRYSWKPKAVEPILKALLARGGDINAVSKDGSTALMVAARNGKAGSIQLLVRHGADVSIKDAAHKTAADHASTPALKKQLLKWAASPAAAAKPAPPPKQQVLPKRLEKFYKTNEAARYKGFVAKGLPYYTGDSRVKLTFVKPGPALLEENEIDEAVRPQWMPLARLNEESEFLAVKLTSPKCPVHLWWHEDGQFLRVSPTLDDFLTKKLVKRSPAR